MPIPFFPEVTGSIDSTSPRHTFESRILIRLERHGQKLSLQGWARDLSESGLGAFVGDELLLGEFVTIEIPLPDFAKQSIPAKVTRVLGTAYGFQFTALSSEQRSQIRAALQERPALPRYGTES